MSEELAADSSKIAAGLGIIRKRRWYLWVVILVYLPAMWTTLQVKPTHKALGTVFVVWLVLLVITATLAAAARCPRCGNYFHMHGMTLLYLRKCLHCQLHVTADRKTRKNDR